jgi:hypothetical protein
VLGAYQKPAGLKVDCWPSEAVLRAMSAASRAGLQTKQNPAECRPGFE